MRPQYELHLGDCKDILPKFDLDSMALITDPPYGIKPVARFGLGKDLKHSFGAEDVQWDVMPPDEYFDLMLTGSGPKVIWGGNYFIDHLHSTRCMLVWDKQNGKNPFADFEIAWTNLDKSCRKLDYFWLGAQARRIEKAYHPTQKPVEVMKWCIEIATEPGDTIIDPFMGSGSTGVAAVLTGRNFIGIEMQQKYYDIAETRIKNALGEFAITKAEASTGQMALFGN